MNAASDSLFWEDMLRSCNAVVAALAKMYPHKDTENAVYESLKTAIAKDFDIITSGLVYKIAEDKLEDEIDKDRSIAKHESARQADILQKNLIYKLFEDNKRPIDHRLLAIIALKKLDKKCRKAIRDYFWRKLDKSQLFKNENVPEHLIDIAFDECLDNYEVLMRKTENAMKVRPKEMLS